MKLLCCPPCAVGACAATLLAWWVPSWRWLTFLCGVATLAYIPSWSMVTESPQWLLLRSKKVGRDLCRARAGAPVPEPCQRHSSRPLCGSIGAVWAWTERRHAYPAPAWVSPRRLLLPCRARPPPRWQP